MKPIVSDKAFGLVALIAMVCLSVLAWDPADPGYTDEKESMLKGMIKKDLTSQVFAEGMHQIFLVPFRHDATASNCVDITGTTAQKTLPTDSDYFEICVYGSGAEAYMRAGASPTATTTTGTGYDLRIAAGECKFREVEEAKIAVIGASATGTVCFYQLLAP